MILDVTVYVLFFNLLNLISLLVFCLQAQLVVLASQISWSESVDAALQTISTKDPNDLSPMNTVLQAVESTLNILADSVLHEQPPVRRKKLEHLVSERHSVNHCIFVCCLFCKFVVVDLFAEIKINDPWFFAI